MKKTRRQRIRNALLRLAIAYALICLALVMFESSLVYVPFDGPTDPAQAGLTEFKKETFTATDGASIPLWEHAKPQGPVILYFHGNGGGLYAFKAPLAYLAEQGFSVVAMEYRGYPGAPGKPSEKALVADALALYDDIKERYADRPIMVWGYSLGSGIAVQLAAQRPIAALILEAPFSAAVDVARSRYPVIPVGWLMRNQYLSREVIGDVKAPIFIMHGDADTIIPILFSEQLYARANDPKQFHRYPQAGHNDLMQTPAYHDAVKFIKTLNH